MTNRFPCNTPRHCWNDRIDIPDGKGFLAIFLKEGKEHEQAIPKKWRKKLFSDNFTKNKRLLYIGRANLKTRIKSHFSSKGSTNDTLRRSIGAMLRSDLKLQPTGLTKKDLFRFCDENPLSRWMQDNCTYSYAVEVSKKKKDLIQDLKPPFNIQHNKQFCHSSLEKALKKCVELAGK